jgi:hypothetical protein
MRRILRKMYSPHTSAPVGAEVIYTATRRVSCLSRIVISPILLNELFPLRPLRLERCRIAGEWVVKHSLCLFCSPFLLRAISYELSATGYGLLSAMSFFTFNLEPIRYEL